VTRTVDVDEVLELSAWVGSRFPPAPGPWLSEAACAAQWLPPAVRLAFTSDAVTAVDDQALAICRRCPVLEACDRYASSAKVVCGVWGGQRRVQRNPWSHRKAA
jgi:hypothetical protein